MKKKMTLIVTMVLLVLSTINVKATGWEEIYTTLEKKGNLTSELYNSMPTEVQRDEKITVRLTANNVSGWKLIDGTNEITWDDKAFKLDEINGKHYRVVSDHINLSRMEVIGSNKALIRYSWKDENVSENNIPFIELDFIVKKDISDGIYKINLSAADDSLRVYGNDNYYNTEASPRTLKYQVGKSKLTSNYTKSEIEDIDNDVYVIGSHLFTRDKNLDKQYEGALTTEFIMLAAKTIEGSDKDAMVIYLKNAFGNWKNAINNTAIDAPESFSIKYINMNENYLENGVYSTNDYNKILRLVQINKDEAIITIESASERIHGIASINGKNASLKIGNKTYAITIGENSISIDGSETLQKRANMSVNDYFNDTYAMAYYSGYDAASHYLQSVHTGKYTKGNYELYLLRVGENTAKICLKEKGQSSCIIDQYIQGNEGFSHNVGASPTTCLKN